MQGEPRSPLAKGATWASEFPVAGDHRATVPTHGLVDQPPAFIDVLGLGHHAEQLFGPAAAVILGHGCTCGIAGALDHVQVRLGRPG